LHSRKTTLKFRKPYPLITEREELARRWTLGFAFQFVFLMLLVSVPATLQVKDSPSSLIIGPNILLGDAYDRCCGWDVTVASSLSNPDNSFIAAAGLHYYTLDGGLTWSPRQERGPFGDPALAYSAGGVLYWANIFGPRGPNHEGLIVYSSSDGGQTWNTPTVAVAPTDVTKENWPDKEWIAVDTSNSSFRDNVYVAWAVLSPGKPSGGNIVGSAIVGLNFSRSVDLGRTFSKPITLATGSGGGENGGSPQVLVGPKGEVYVIYQSYIEEHTILIQSSLDGGLTFSTPRYVASAYSVPGKVANTQIRVFTIESAAVDSVKGFLYAVWSDYRSRKSEVLISMSEDGGQSWSSPRRVNDDTSPSDHFMPSVAVGRDGAVHVAWLDRRDDPTNTAYNVYYAQSVNGGKSFEKNLKVSSASSNPNNLQDPSFIGDYIGISVDGHNRVHVAWNDARSGGTAETYTATIFQEPNILTSSTSTGTTGTPSTSVASITTVSSLRSSASAASSQVSGYLAIPSLSGPESLAASLAVSVVLIGIVLAMKHRRNP
jgi:hypothetical protein